MLTRSVRAALVACALLLLAVAAATAVAAKPKGIPIYKQCTTRTKCSAQATSNPNGKALALNFSSAKCPEFSQVLSSGVLGSVNPNSKTGKFKIVKDVSGQSPKDQSYHVFHVTISGVAKFKKSIKGTWSATTDAPDCPASAQKPTTFKLKFAGLAYGG
jgi:hypothetical protein